MAEESLIKQESENKEKVYTFGGDKIKEEIKAAEKKRNKEAKIGMAGDMTIIIEHVSQKCAADPDYNDLVIQSHKSWKRCYDFIIDKARKAAAGSGSYFSDDNTVLGWIDEYYKKDDKAEAEAEKKKAEEAVEKAKKAKERKAAESREKSSEKKQKALFKERAEVTGKKAEKLKSEQKNTDGQMSLFEI